MKGFREAKYRNKAMALLARHPRKKPKSHIRQQVAAEQVLSPVPQSLEPTKHAALITNRPWYHTGHDLDDF